MTTRMLKLPDVCARTCLARSTIYEMMSRGDFPRPFKTGLRAVAWREDDLEAWLLARPSADAR